MTTLRETLAEHPPQETSYDAGWIEGCWCGWELPRRIDNDEGWAAYFAHLEAVVLAWVGARLAGADVLEGVADALDDERSWSPSGVSSAAAAAIRALGEALGTHEHADNPQSRSDRQPGGSTGPSCGCAPDDPPCQRTLDGRGGHLWHGGTTNGGQA